MAETKSAYAPSTRQRSERKVTVKSGTRDETEGKWHQAKGKIKEIVGKVSMNHDLETEGEEESRGGYPTPCRSR